MIHRNQKIWVVVGVWRGLLSTVRAFQNEEEADKCALRLKKQYKPIEDEVGVFEVAISGKPTNTH
jgi:hypothetical protein